jgi:hypothetical protein
MAAGAHQRSRQRSRRTPARRPAGNTSQRQRQRQQGQRRRRQQDCRSSRRVQGGQQRLMVCRWVRVPLDCGASLSTSPGRGSHSAHRLQHCPVTALTKHTRRHPAPPQQHPGNSRSSSSSTTTTKQVACQRRLRLQASSSSSSLLARHNKQRRCQGRRQRRRSWRCQQARRGPAARRRWRRRWAAARGTVAVAGLALQQRGPATAQQPRPRRSQQVCVFGCLPRGAAQLPVPWLGVASCRAPHGNTASHVRPSCAAAGTERTESGRLPLASEGYTNDSMDVDAGGMQQGASQGTAGACAHAEGCVCVCAPRCANMPWLVPSAGRVRAVTGVPCGFRTVRFACGVLLAP